MAVPSAPTNFYCQTANGQILVSWDLSAGATSYDVQRSTNNVTFASVATVSSNQYLDTTVSLGVQYFYKIASINGSGTGIYTQVQSEVPATQGEMTLGQIRLSSQETADRVNSNFVTLPEWNKFINLALFELYDLLIDVYEDYFVAPAVTFTADGTTFLYSLPDGQTTFTGPAGTPIVAAPFYKLMGVDLALNTAQNGWVTINKFNFIDRNKFLYPNSASTIYGVFNCRYRLVGNKIEFIPTPSGGQIFRLWYFPRMQMLLQDTDTTTMGVSGWLRYVIVRAAKYALDKEESDTTKLDQELLFLKSRIESASMNRDAGQADTISDVRSPFGSGSGGSPGGGMQGGW